MSTDTINGTALRDLTPAERKAVDLRARGATDAAIRIETGLSAEQIDVAVKRHTAWQKMRGKAAAAEAIAAPDPRRTISALLAWAEGSNLTRAMTVAARVREYLNELRNLQEQTEARAQAQADVDRLTAELEAAKAKLRQAGSGTARTGRPAGATPAPDRKEFLATVRKWATDNGHEISPLGRLPENVMQAYRAATGDDR
jgi:hypothetical protein